MKISKVKNTRTGIGLKNNTNKEISGIIYDNTKEPDARRDIRQHIEIININAKKLYSPFNSKSMITKVEEYKKKHHNEKKLYKEAEKTIKTKCKLFLRNIAAQKDFNIQSVENELSKQIIEEKNGIINSTFCENIINKCLRKSLSKSVKTEDKTVCLKSIMEKVVKVVAGLIELSEITEFELHILYDAVYEDYNKEQQIEKWVKSFENKNTKVQVVTVDGEKRLELSSIQNEKKKFISDFIHCYASCEKDGQNHLLEHQRRLILLYVCGAEKYKLAENVNLMQKDWGGLLPEDKENISDEIYASICDEGTNHTLKSFDTMRMERYGKAIRAEGISENDKRWIGYYNEEVGKLFKKRNNRTKSEKIGSKYLVTFLWKRWTSFIAGKYIDLGKAVYHFVMPQDTNINKDSEVSFGTIQEPYQNGILSFDYERIKAKESLERELAVYITFAVNIFSRAIAKNEYLEKNEKEDVLLLKEEELDNALKDSVKKRIMQYFGGMSRWKDTEIVNLDEKKLFLAIKDEISIVRNAYYHYSTEKTAENSENNKLIELLYKHEYKNVGYTVRKKYYSNNALIFYKESDINAFMKKLYEKPSVREAQIPAYGNIFKKADCKSFIKQQITDEVYSNLYDGREIFYSTFYFMAKEMYYYEFLQLPDLLERFYHALQEVNEVEIAESKRNNIANSKEKAKENFKTYLKEHCTGKSFGELCQCVMTEYNQQNQNIKEVRTREEKEKNKEIYQHFRMLLYTSLKEAFEQYLLEKKELKEYNFVFNPEYKPEKLQQISEEKFCTNYSVGLFSDIKSLDRQELYAWYVISHFITAKQLNHLQGAIKNYLQFIKDIERRAFSTCNRLSNIEKEEVYYTGILKVLSVVMVQSGQISHKFDDYFTSEDDYAKFLANYVHYTDQEPSVERLKEFCNKTVDSLGNKTKNRGGNGLADINMIFHKSSKASEQKIGIYCDDKNPILNKNIIYSKLYGLEKQISKVYKVQETDIKTYYDLKNSLQDTFKKEKCQSVEEQEKLRNYQDIKNKVELYDVTTYTEILIDCMAQLVSYSYLRERDNMYMQLGYHYVKLYYGKEILEEKDEKLLNITNGAILYQIFSIYNHGAEIIKKTKGGTLKWGSKGQISAKINQFVSCYSEEKYFEGLYFFENINMHDKYAERRNYIDHMKYLSKTDTSIMEMFSWIYNGFFDYDIKLKKSVSFILNNILMKYFVVLKLNIVCTENTYQVLESQTSGTKNKKDLTMKETLFKAGSADSEKFIYKQFRVKEGKRSKILELPARSKEFCQNIRKLLMMKED